MSFFNFDATLPRDRPHDSRAPGFGPVPDAFAGLSQQDLDEGDVLDFEETYDGLGDQLDDADDALNTDTFGTGTVGKDFDFSGQTAKMDDTLQDEQLLYHARQTLPKVSQPQAQSQPASKPARSGYEKYHEPSYIPQLQASSDIWGPSTQPKSQQPQQTLPPQQFSQVPQQPLQQQQRQSQAASAATSSSKKMMSLEEVEASMSKQKPLPKSPQPPAQPPYEPPPPSEPVRSYASHPPQILQRPQQQQHQGPSLPQFQEPSLRVPGANQAQQPPQQPGVLPIAPQAQPSTYQQLHHQPNREQSSRRPVSNEGRPLQAQPSGPSRPQWVEANQNPQIATLHRRGPSYNGQAITHPDQVANMSEQERAAFMEEEARRAKRNHKIHLMSKDNGLMTPQDKNFITRIQLQQLLTATGNVDEQSSDAALAEDFYYHVYSQIRGAPRQNPNQPLNHFAQTYLNQTGTRAGSRRYPRGGESHMRRMEQQVQRAVESAKLKPKNRQLVIEGSLGKISFSNAKTPKPLLNLKRPENSEQRPQSSQKPKTVDHDAGRKATLRNIENLYNCLMRMEDHERRMPAQTTEESSADEIQAQIEWRAKTQELNQALWQSLKVMEPIDPNSATIHPFIAILSHPKGKKVIPRVFRQIDDQQRLTVLTMIVIHLDVLDVTKLAVPQTTANHETPQIPRAVRDEIDLYSQTVMPCLLGYINEASMDTVTGLVGLIMDRVNVPAVMRTKVGLGLLTMFLSRAELIKESGHAADADKSHWSNLFDRLFDLLEPHLNEIFTATSPSEDVYVWQFLATVGIGASPDQQQRLVLAVKDRVMDTVTVARTLPSDVGRPRLDNVNLFMKALGLDVELLG